MNTIKIIEQIFSAFGALGWIELFGAFVVAIGCAGELWILVNKLTRRIEPMGKTSSRFWRSMTWVDAKIRPLLLVLKINGRKLSEPKEQLLERFFVLLVAIGVAVEFICLPISMKEVADLNIKAGNAWTLSEKIGTTNAQLLADNLVLQTNVNETKKQLANAEVRLNESLLNLKKENLPMDVGDQYSFVNALKPMIGMQVELRCAVDTKSQETAESIFSIFSMAGWPVINRAFIGDIGEQGVVIGYGRTDAAKQAAFLLFKLLTERDVPSKIINDLMGMRVRGVPTNAIIVAVMNRPSQLEADLMVVQAKENILKDQEPSVFSRIMELASKRYAVGSKEMAAAQAEYNELNLQYSKLENEIKNISEQSRNLEASVDKELFGTNSPGVHIYNNSISGGSSVFMIGGAGTNSPKIFMRNEHVDVAPLQ